MKPAKRSLALTLGALLLITLPSTSAVEVRYELTSNWYTTQVTPLQGTTDVVSFYAYGNYYGRWGAGPNVLSATDRSRLYLYRDPAGTISLVILHDTLEFNGGNFSGGQVRFNLWIPSGTTYIVQDKQGAVGLNTWTWGSGDGAGGVLSGTLNGEFTIEIDPLAMGGINIWEWLSGSLSSPNFRGLDMSSRVTITARFVNAAPTNILLSNTKVNENAAGGTLVGSLSATDPNAGDTQTFSLMDSAGGRFQIVGNQLKVAPGAKLDYETATSHTVIVRATDQGGLWYAKSFSITVNDVPDTFAYEVIQNGVTTQVPPLQGTKDAVSFYDYTGAISHTGLEKAQAARCFLYRDPAGNISLVILLSKDGNGSGDATLGFSGVPSGTTFIVRDDSGEAALPESAWSWSMSDGGVLSGSLGGEFAISVTPAYWNGITSWEWLSGSLSSPSVHSLALNDSITIRARSMGGSAPMNISLSGTSVNENSAGGTLVGSLSATDPDAEDTQTFSLTASAGGRFQIVGNQLQVAPGASLDYETATSHTITVRATDLSGLTFDKSFAISVNNLFDVAPTTVTLTGTTVSENSPGGTIVGTLAAADVETGDSHTFALTDNAGGRFEIAGNKLQVAAGANLDYEAATTHSVIVIATDKGGLTSPAKTFTVAVLNVYDVPASNILLAGTTVTENAAAGTVVGTLSATDPEPGDVNTFSLSDNAGGRFQIVGSQFKVASGATLDYEAATSHNVTVVATDKGGQTFSKSFVVSVNNVFDVAPTDVLLSGTSVTENSAAGTVVGNLSAADVEAGDTHTFSLTDSAGGRFQIAGSQLKVAAGATLNYEAATSHNVTVVTTDKGGQTFSKSFVISLNNVFDVAPTDVLLSGTSVTENSAAGTVVGNLSVVDVEVGDSHTFTLTVNPGGRFQIAGNQLQVAAGAVLDYETATSHSITVVARDQGGLNSPAKAFTITLNNVFDVAPTGISLSATTINENSAAGAVVGNLAATDVEAGDSHTFTLTDSAGGRFEIAGGKLQVAAGANLDYESATSHNVSVVATDRGGLTFSKSFVIGINNLFDVPPTGISLTGAIVNENSFAGTLVGTLSAVDVEVGDTHTFGLTDSAGGRFMVVGNQLRVASGADLDFVAAPSHAITVRATDRGNLTFEKSFTISVANVNETPSDITLTGRSAPENSPGGTVVGELSVVDPDPGDTHTFSLSSDAGGRFKVIGQQLQVASGASLNFESAKSHDITVRATDQGGLALNQSFTVTVVDLNEAPTGIFVSGTVVFEDFTAGRMIGKLTADDPDANNTHTFTLIDSAGGRFQVSGDQLQVAAGATFDFKTAPHLQITVRVSDQNGLTLEQGFTINVVPPGSLLGARGPQLVKGILPGSSYWLRPDNFAYGNGILFFAVDDSTHGRELWKTDGTEAGTLLVKDINPGRQSSDPQSLTVMNGMVFFTVNGFPDRELWKSDGTEAGTVRVKDINPGIQGSDPVNLTPLNGTLFFSAYDPAYGQEVWKSDGTEAGTARVKDIYPGSFGSSPRNFTSLNGLLFFSADGGANTGFWKSDGTEAGTVRIKDLNPRNFTPLNGLLFFSAYDAATGWEFWRSDGTATGTVLVKDLYPGSYTSISYSSSSTYPNSSSPNNFTVVNGTLFFAATDGIAGSELWKSDGTAAGTVRVKDISPGSPGSSPESLTPLNGTLFFTTYDNVTGRALWKSDGTAAGTVLVKAKTGSVLAAVDGQLFFTATDPLGGMELWQTDGTKDGTFCAGDIYPGPIGSDPANFTAAGNTLFFTANYGIAGPELWKTGILTPSDLAVTIGDSPDPVNIGDNLTYTVTASNNGPALSSGVILTLALPPGVTFVASSAPSTQASNVLTFALGVLPNGSSARVSVTATVSLSLTSSRILAATATARATEPDPKPENNVAIREYTVAKALPASALGATLVKNINPSLGSDLVPIGSNPENLTAVNGTLFYRANDGIAGTELWKSDGTPEGTILVKDISAGPGSSFPDTLVQVNNTLYFAANDGATGKELWKSDGTQPGTTLVKDIASGPGGSSVTNITAVNGMLFFTATDPVRGSELWKSDGTEAGTVLVKDIKAGKFGSDPGWLLAVDSVLYFAASDREHGRELWKSDGTEAGTVLVKNIGEGDYYVSSGYYSLWESSPVELANLNGTVYFSAFTESSGRELWKTDGTAGGTLQAAEIASESYWDWGDWSWHKDNRASSNPAELTAVNSTLFFSAYSGRFLLKAADTFGASPVGSAADTSDLTAVNGTLFFAGSLSGERRLWKAGGTYWAANMVGNVRNPTGLTAVDGQVVFSGEDGFRGSEVWKSDGTDAGTVLLREIRSGSSGSSPKEFTKVNGKVFFTADDGVTGRELWKIEVIGLPDLVVTVKDSPDPVAPGSELTYTITVRNDGPVEASLVTVTNVRQNVNLSFVSASDGGALEGESVRWSLGTIGPGASKIVSVTYRIDERTPSMVLKTVTTAAGSEADSNPSNNTGLACPALVQPKTDPNLSAVLVKDIALRGGRLISGSVVINGILFFSVADAVNGSELWKSDGTEAGTVLVYQSRRNTKLANLVSFGGNLFFSVYQLDYYGGYSSYSELWKSDGTNAGTVLVKVFYSGDSLGLDGFVSAGGVLFFSARDGSGRELWKSDGTTAGTVLVRDIAPLVSYVSSDSSNPAGFVNFNDALFFAATDTIGVRGLWKSDGTTAGTVLVKHNSWLASWPWDGRERSGPLNVTVVNGKLFFSASEGGLQSLWTSDGTEAGTVLVKQFASLYSFAAVNDKLFFGARGELWTTGEELWMSDGTAAGTVQVMGSTRHLNFNPMDLTVVNGKLFFTANDPRGRELWTSDGTESGTACVKDIYPGSSGPTHLFAANGKLFFTALDASGYELWTSDGTAAGTLPVGDIYYGPGSSFPQNFASINGTLLFWANNGVNGTALHRLQVTNPTDIYYDPATATKVVILNRGDQSLTVEDLPAPKGFMITAAAVGGATPAKVSACDGSAILTLRPGSSVVVTRGSVIVEVAAGTVEVEFVGLDGTRISATLEAGDSVEFEPSSLVMSAFATNTREITFAMGASQFSLLPGDDVTLPDTTPPLISETVTGTLGSNGWYTSDVQLTWNADDLNSEVRSTAGDRTVSVAADTSGFETSFAATSEGGTSLRTATIRRDTAPPVIQTTQTPEPNSNGWNNTDVMVSFAASDLTSGIDPAASALADRVFTAEAVDGSASGTAVDWAGHSASATVEPIKIDKTPPTVVHGGPYFVNEGGSVVLDGSGSTDALSGIAEFAWDIDGDGFDDGNASTLTLQATDGPATLAVSLKVVDQAGNETVATTEVTIHNVAPSVTAQNAEVAISEGQTALNSGAFFDPGNDTVVITANLGAVTQTAGGWNWQFDCRHGQAGTFLITITATDSDGASSETSFKLVVKDVLPILSGPSNITVHTDPGQCGAVVNYAAVTGQDGCGTVVVTQQSGLTSGSQFPVGTTQNLFEGTDEEGNKAIFAFAVTVEDHEAPIITLNGSNDLLLVAQMDIYQEPGASATDACAPILPVAIGGDVVDDKTPGTYSVTYDAVDKAGNKAKQLTRAVRVAPSFAGYALFAQGKLKTDKKAVTAPGQVSLDEACAVVGSVGSNGKVELLKAGSVKGDIASRAEDVSIGEASKVEGAIDADGKVEIHKASLVTGDVTSLGKIDLKQDARVQGNVVSAETVKLEKGAAVGGTITERAKVAPLMEFYLPTLQFVFGGQKVTVPKSQTSALPPGAYGPLKLEQGATLNLSSGYYAFDAIVVEKDGRIQIDLAQGLIVIDVKENVDLKDNVQMTAQLPPGGSVEDILLRVVGNTVTLGKGGSYLGTVLAPNAQVSLEESAKLNGALYGEKVDAKKGTEIHGAPAFDLLIWTVNPKAQKAP